MPSPIAHTAVGYVIYAWNREAVKTGDEALPLSLATIVGISLLPDLDIILALLTGNVEQTHNNWTHSPVTGLTATLIGGSALWFARRKSWRHWAVTIFICYELHVLMDFFTVGRGVMLLLPFSHERYSAPVAIFYGLRWSQGVFSSHHVWTIATELLFAVVVLIVSSHLSSRKNPNAS